MHGIDHTNNDKQKIKQLYFILLFYCWSATLVSSNQVAQHIAAIYQFLFKAYI